MSQLSLPEVVKVTQTFVLVSCPYLIPENREIMKKEFCGRCGLHKDAAAKNLHLVCLHPESQLWTRFLAKADI